MTQTNQNIYYGPELTLEFFKKGNAFQLRGTEQKDFMYGGILGNQRRSYRQIDIHHGSYIFNNKKRIMLILGAGLSDLNIEDPDQVRSPKDMRMVFSAGLKGVTSLNKFIGLSWGIILGVNRHDNSAGMSLGITFGKMK